MKRIVFLTLAEVIGIHNDQIERYGGAPGLRDIGLLSSALAMPYASFSGELMHADLFDMAAAYAFHLSQNHPFIDGNKRTALASSLVFLDMNGIRISNPQGELFDAMLSIATGRMDKPTFADVLRSLKE